jgi:fatty-acid peroxygenase
MVAMDETLPLALNGYAWLPDRRRAANGAPVVTRLMGQRAVGLCGPDAARFFYDESHVRRHTAIPEPVQGTLFGHRAVHTLDGGQHRDRKAMFVSLLMGDGIDSLVAHTLREWDTAAATWAGGPPVVLFDEAARVIARGVCRWTGIPLDDAEAPGRAADLVALVDGFATVGPRHWRARRARGRLQRWLGGLVDGVRDGSVTVPADSALASVARHREDGRLLDAKLAAVELLNIIRPTTAVTWFVAFSAHALHRWPQHREALQAGDPGRTVAFVHEVRRFYPFAPFIGGRAVRDLTYAGVPIRKGSLVLLDLYGQNHDPLLWPEPYRFAPERFTGRSIGEFDLVPQGGGDPRTGHRCPGEQITVALLGALAQRLARLDYTLPRQDLDISLRRIPARPSSGIVLSVSPAMAPARTGGS